MKPAALIASFRQLARLWPLFPAAIYLLGFLVVVLVYLFGMSFSVVEGAGGHAAVSLAPAMHVLRSHDFRQALINTLLFVAVGTPVELVAGLWLSLMLYQSFQFRSLVRSVFVIPLAIPALVTATILFILFDYPGGHVNQLLLGRYGIVPALIHAPINWRGSMLFSLGISLAGKVWRDMPISMLILLAGLNAIDPELLDAARTMGAGLRKQLRHLILPLIIPSISAVVLLRSIEMWKEFIFPFVLAGRYNLLGTLIESLYNDWGYSHEAAVVALLLVGCIVASAFALMRLCEVLKRALVQY
jgi:ABC-type sugar transport system permease subunit